MSELPSLQGHEMFETSGLNVVFDALEKAGGQGRIVGGAVRNAVLGEPVHDIDIATQLLPEQVIEAAKSSGLKAIETGNNSQRKQQLRGHHIAPRCSNGRAPRNCCLYG